MSVAYPLLSVTRALAGRLRHWGVLCTPVVSYTGLGQSIDVGERDWKRKWASENIRASLSCLASK